MKLSEFFYNDDLLQTKADTVTDGSQLFLFYMIKQKLPTSITDKDGNTITINFLGDSLLKANYWRIFQREYLFNYSKDKESSVLVDAIAEDSRFLDTTSYTWYKTYIDMLATDIVAKYGDNWCRLWYAINEKYRPLDNKDGSAKTISNNYSRDVVTDNWDANKTDATSTSATQNTYGFNSASGVPQASNSATSTPSNTLDAVNEGIPENQHSINEGSSHMKETQTGNLERLEHGNIGVTMTQQLLEAEYEYRENYNFYHVVFDNIDDVLTCKTYGGDV